MYCYGDGRLLRVASKELVSYSKGVRSNQATGGGGLVTGVKGTLRGGKLWDSAVAQAEARKAAPAVFMSMIAQVGWRVVWASALSVLG